MITSFIVSFFYSSAKLRNIIQTANLFRYKNHSFSHFSFSHLVIVVASEGGGS